ncbi:hypothetical protein XELAEV_18040720mg [Xenopus laevis]|uniref:Uncharacterized protein n=1 Tax=Xenopus laevis TaxID=8355 RepID=A0A974CA41_XENLA|nr:hypothetical protein XELAEV_18040720mg [Xenopus laevis]
MFIWASEVEGLQSSSQRLDCLTYSGENGSTCIASYQLEPYTPIFDYQEMYNVGASYGKTGSDQIPSSSAPGLNACSDGRSYVWRSRTGRANSSLCTHAASRASM